MLAAWEVEPEASAVEKLSVGFPKGRLSMKGVMFTWGGTRKERSGGGSVRGEGANRPLDANTHTPAFLHTSALYTPLSLFLPLRATGATNHLLPSLPTSLPSQPLFPPYLCDGPPILRPHLDGRGVDANELPSVARDVVVHAQLQGLQQL